jgi:anti-sigma regulatory factor (Ser/Thr protein kinase)
MTGVRARGEAVRRFILENVGNNPTEIARIAAERFGVTRQAIHKHLQRLVTERALEESGQTRSRVYRLAALSEWRKEYPIRPGLSEDQVWREDVRLVLGGMPANVINIWQHGLTEIFNNALDHANADRIVIRIEKTAVDTVMSIADDGIGIFRKIQDELGLQDPRQAVLELSKGKMTTDPTRHSGEGIFFTTRMFERFSIHSGGVRFEHRIDPGHDYTLETGQPDAKGTTVSMTLDNHTSRTTKDVFDRFTDTEEYTFSKTVVPVELAVYGDENLISRSQAKRLLARVENFRTVTFDFHDVPSIGQAFADEIFRVFQSQHPDIRLVPINYSEEIGKMIGRARSGTVKSPV